MQRHGINYKQGEYKLPELLNSNSYCSIPDMNKESGFLISKLQSEKDRLIKRLNEIEMELRKLGN
jgi:hypothetical protein